MTYILPEEHRLLRQTVRELAAKSPPPPRMSTRPGGPRTKRWTR